MTAGYTKKMVSIKAGAVAEQATHTRSKARAHLQLLKLHPKLMKWEGTLFICFGCELWKSALTPWFPNSYITIRMSVLPIIQNSES